MSFKVAISDVTVCNEALALLPQGPIVSLAEQSPEALECRRAYKPVVAEMLEMHHWGLARKRVTLAQIVNDRDEWGFAYAKPSDLAYPVALHWTGGGAWGWFNSGATWFWEGRPMFEMSGTTIYTNMPGARVDYTSFDITEADFTPLFKRIVVLELAARLAQPVTKSSARMRELIAQAEGERQRVIANDMNRNRPTYGNRPTESEMARFGMVGYEGGRYSPATPIDPVSDPIGATVVPDGVPPGTFYYEG